MFSTIYIFLSVEPIEKKLSHLFLISQHFLVESVVVGKRNNNNEYNNNG